MKPHNILVLMFLILLIQACSLFENKQIIKMDPKINYERDLIIQVNGVTREGSITMPLKSVNTIHVWSPGNIDMFLLKTCGGVFKKLDSWKVEQEVPSGLFGWGTKKIEVKNQLRFTINATDFHEVGICPLYLVGVSKTDSKNAEGYINWQTEEYKLKGYLVCNMEKRQFDGVEACSIAAGSYVKVVFDEPVFVSPNEGCEMGPTEDAKTFQWRAKSGVCNYEVESLTTGKRGNFHVYGYDEPTLR